MKKINIHGIKLNILLVIIFLILGIAPFTVQQIILINSFEQAQIDTKKTSIQNQAVILSTKMSINGYYSNADSDQIMDSGIESLASVFDGRVVIINKSYKIMKDTFSIATGKINIAPEIIRCFQGESSSGYNEEKHYIIQTVPVYSASDSTQIDGVLLVMASTESIHSTTGKLRDKNLILVAIMILVLAAVSILLSNIIVKPFNEMSDTLKKVSEGDLNQRITQDTYMVTKRMSSAINDTLKKLKDVDQSRHDFVANVSHELKTPITSIRVLADSLMSMDEVPEGLYKEFMNDISYEIDRESKIIDDLLSLVKLDKSEGELNLEQVNIGLMLEQILKRLRPIAKMRNVEMTLESLREVIAEADEMKLSLAISNLCENAIKYNNEGGWVRVSIDADHQFGFIRISDSGIGIPEDCIGQVFERFYRVDKARSRETGGTGLGLSITRNIIMMHKGTVKVTSKPGEGTTFLVRIPLSYIREK